jgi:hypothetical protein
VFTADSCDPVNCSEDCCCRPERNTHCHKAFKIRVAEAMASKLDDAEAIDAACRASGFRACCREEERSV